uniref:Phosphatidylethanolamine-binding protein n=1 Tax=Plectus sambesii TaxID=2011161 RepID=A0A914UW74_9BILA
VNIIGKDLSSGQTLTSYVGPGPPPTTGLHRYVLLVYKQKAEILDTEWGDKNRASWSAANFAKKHDLGDPVAGNFFQAKNAVQ